MVWGTSGNVPETAISIMLTRAVAFGILLVGDNMLKYTTKCLQTLLTIVSIVTFVNVLVMFWIPILIPLSSFSAVRTMFVAFMEKRYYLIPVSVLICVLLFLSTISIRRQHILLPALSFLYLIYDFIIVLSLLMDGLGDGYWRTYIIQTVILIAVIVLFCIYGYLWCTRIKARTFQPF